MFIMRRLRIIIAGGRDFDNYIKLKRDINGYLKDFHYEDFDRGNITIISGGAKGADKLGEQYAKELGFKCKIFKANWNKHGKSAGPIRNTEMSKVSDILIAFWDGKSRGTKDMISKMSNKIIVIYGY